MDNVRFFLVLAVSFLGLLLYQKWQQDYPSNPVQTNSTQIQNAATTASVDSERELPKIQPSFEIDPSFDRGEASGGSSDIKVTTDLFALTLSSLGAGINQVGLLKYPVEQDRPSESVQLLANNAERLFIYQSGLAGDTTLPTHYDSYYTPQDKYSLEDLDDELIVPFQWTSDTGIKVKKEYVLKRHSYLIQVKHTIVNNSQASIKLHQYDQLKRSRASSRKGMLYLFTGAALSTPEKRYEKFDYGDLEDAPLAVNAKDSWIAVMEHYFVAALIPNKNIIHHFYSKTDNKNRFTVGHYSPGATLAPGEQHEFSSSIYIGPKRHDILEKTAPGLNLSVDYGMLWFLAKPLFVVLTYVHKMTGNWGWAIVILTILLKLMFYPLAAAGYRSMANMRKVQPRLLALKDRYSGDKAQLNQAMMQLYKEEKINPLGGCLPMLVQIPFFIALYWVLLESVEIRQAPFIFWITDLSSLDPFYVLPLLMGVTMWFQQKLNPAPLDPMQAKVMKILPFVFTGFFAFFPSGLVLYWLVNNLLSIAQQYRITKLVESESV
jgi:YidC/Oxa1 family membrane protein insertase